MPGILLSVCVLVWRSIVTGLIVTTSGAYQRLRSFDRSTVKTCQFQRIAHPSAKVAIVWLHNQHRLNHLGLVQFGWSSSMTHRFANFACCATQLSADNCVNVTQRCNGKWAHTPPLRVIVMQKKQRVNPGRISSAEVPTLRQPCRCMPFQRWKCIK